ncbi:hypothetical protein ACSQ67_012037 [Phaseolus vulgaris]
MDFLSPTLSLSTAACPAWSGPPYIWQRLFLYFSLSVTFSLLSHHTLSISALVQSQKILTWVSIESDRPQKRAFSFNVTLHSQLSWRSRGTCHRCCRAVFVFWGSRVVVNLLGCCGLWIWALFDCFKVVGFYVRALWSECIGIMVEEEGVVGECLFMQWLEAN